MKRLKRIKWFNIATIIMFIACFALLASDFITLATSTACYTLKGAISAILALIVINMCREYLIDEYEKIK